MQVDRQASMRVVLARSLWLQGFARQAKSAALEALAGHDEMKMDAGEDLGVLFGPLRVDFYHAVGDLRAPPLQDVHDVVRRAAPGSDQHGLHGTWPEIAAAAFGCATPRSRIPRSICSTAP